MTTVAVLRREDPRQARPDLRRRRVHPETYGELELRSRRIAHALRARGGMEPGDSIAALVIGNDDAFFDIFWAAHRTGPLLHAR